MENSVAIVEAMIFASGDGVKKSYILESFPDLSEEELTFAINEIAKKYNKDGGVRLFIFNNKYQFGTNPLYSTPIAEKLKPQKEKELTTKVMEVLALIAYHQPITKGDIEDIRGVSPDYAVDVLLRSNLIYPKGRKKNAAGKPILYATTEYFLKRFDLKSLKELPQRRDIEKRLRQITKEYETATDLYKSKNVADNIEDELTELEKQVEATERNAANVDDEQDIDKVIAEQISEEDILLFGDDEVKPEVIDFNESMEADSILEQEVLSTDSDSGDDLSTQEDEDNSDT